VDQGPGIPDDFRQRIFGKFSQADSSSARRAGGTGLGLHISRQIVEHMQGRIGFDTAVGHGTTFWIELPAAEAATAGTPTRQTA
jgi:signal transduction histidine kinase